MKSRFREYFSDLLNLRSVKKVQLRFLVRGRETDSISGGEKLITPKKMKREKCVGLDGIFV